jgi:hypothetical protein
MFKPDSDKAKNIVCALVHLSGGTFEGKTRLNKAFWWAHVFHYRNQSGLLSKYPIARLPEGPVIDDCDALLVNLEREGRIEIGEQPKGDYNETVIKLTSAPPMLEEDEMISLKESIAWIRGKSAAAVSKESHQLSVAWQKGKNGEIMDLAFDALDNDDAKEMAKREQSILEHLAHANDLVENAFR